MLQFGTNDSKPAVAWSCAECMGSIGWGYITWTCDSCHVRVCSACGGVEDIKAKHRHAPSLSPPRDSSDEDDTVSYKAPSPPALEKEAPACHI